MDIEEKINQRLKQAGIIREILTEEEIEQLKNEIEMEENGVPFLDGVLANPDLLYRRYEYKQKKLKGE